MKSLYKVRKLRSTKHNGLSCCGTRWRVCVEGPIVPLSELIYSSCKRTHHIRGEPKNFAFLWQLLKIKHKLTDSSSSLYNPGLAQTPPSYAAQPMTNGLTGPPTPTSSDTPLGPPHPAERTLTNHSDSDGGLSNAGTRRSVRASAVPHTSWFFW